MGRNTTGDPKDDSITIKVPSEFKERIKALMIGSYEHFEFQRFILYLIGQGMILEDAERDLKDRAIYLIRKKSKKPERPKIFDDVTKRKTGTGKAL